MGNIIADRFQEFNYFNENLIYENELATLTNIFTNGNNIEIKASIPEEIDNPENTKNKHISLNILQGSSFYMLFNEFLVDLFYKELYPYDSYSNHETLNKTIAKHLSQTQALLTLQGRNNKQIPFLGFYVETLSKAGGSALQKLTPTEKYCFIGDLLFYSGIFKLKEFKTFEENEEEWRKKPNKEKYDMVKSWENSWQNYKEKL